MGHVPKTTSQRPSSIRLSMHAPDMRSFSFMNGFSGYNQIQIWKENRYKNAFTTPWGTFTYQVIPFGIKNVGDTFHCSMTHCFRDLIHIMLAYHDNLIAMSHKQAQHIDDLWQAFLRCRKYKIRFNIFKCVFCVPTRRLLGFIVSHKGMNTNPLKVQTTFPLTSPL